ncbi:MAG: type II toxin-antitoxin system PemK/MazF family toxin [Chloroflexi bacterium]|nr:type II toxin-antitoxin system PemK/MazF family toxin [Chloroflexota bacterium]MDA1219106.1 type II toxin-antitoxin system PemK/MazF family toxin [Chloroflexota bacterium]
MKRGEVYSANLNPTEGSEQSGTRPVIIVSRDAINDNSPVVLIVPCTTDRGQRIYPSQIQVRGGEGGLRQNSVAMAEQVRAIDKGRLQEVWGTLPDSTVSRLSQALMIALDLPG